MNATERACFVLHVRPDRLDDYRQQHANVWPEMQDALRAAGWHNYSLFLRDDGMLVGYVECDDFDAARARMAATGVNARWQAAMAPLFADLGDRAADEAMRPLPEIFHLP